MLWFTTTVIPNRGLRYSQRRSWSYLISSHYLTGAINHVDMRLFLKVNWHKTGGKTRALLKVFPFFSEVMRRPLRGLHRWRYTARSVCQIEWMPWGEGHGNVGSLTKWAVAFARSVSPSLPHCPHTRETRTSEDVYMLDHTQTQWRIRVHVHDWTLRSFVTVDQLITVDKRHKRHRPRFPRL